MNKADTAQTSEPIYEIRRPFWLWLPLAMVLPTAAFLILAVLGWFLSEEASFDRGFWTVAGLIYVVAVVLLFLPVAIWIWMIRDTQFHGRSRLARKVILVCFLFTVLLTMAFGFAAAPVPSDRTGALMFGAFIFVGVGALFYFPSAVAFTAIILRRVE